MRRSSSWLYATVFCFLGRCTSVVMPPEEEDYSYSFAASLRQCLEVGGGAAAVIPCLSKGAVSGLIDAAAEDNLVLAQGITLTNEEDDKLRTLLPIDRDPTDYRTMLEAASSFLSRRALHWDMSTVYPGLVLKVGPSLPGSGGGILQFILDRRHPSNFDERTLNTGHLLVRQMVLPMILGMKINLTALIPLFFLVVALISKKAMLFSKLAVLVSGFLGLNSLFLLQRHQQQQQYSYNHDNRPYFGGSFSNLGPQLFKGVSHKEDQTARGGGRNFLWEDTDKFNRD